ncbi:hypothetical protein PPTG_22268 [Phytophthora nicotianae INRA-310]|uniref:Uncharacterized protein n=1 Tax=Phytophthora nicotianae (strain INRA-310) TaxID=761204 RepID=W2QL77_PHYN3|nr:hypothetical protein PPTG_22268 [Phytophthora nicotianae INRA-310]ETN13893.1 hypothetical protein PPTG_22268 [Phytophthora nicotianae INRA-310]
MAPWAGRWGPGTWAEPRTCRGGVSGAAEPAPCCLSSCFCCCRDWGESCSGKCERNLPLIVASAIEGGGKRKATARAMARRLPIAFCLPLSLPSRAQQADERSVGCLNRVTCAPRWCCRLATRPDTLWMAWLCAGRETHDVTQLVRTHGARPTRFLTNRSER